MLLWLVVVMVVICYSFWLLWLIVVTIVCCYSCWLLWLLVVPVGGCYGYCFLLLLVLWVFLVFLVVVGFIVVWCFFVVLLKQSPSLTSHLKKNLHKITKYLSSGLFLTSLTILLFCFSHYIDI